VNCVALRLPAGGAVGSHRCGSPSPKTSVWGEGKFPGFCGSAGAYFPRDSLRSRSYYTELCFLS
jgi:hypothetical protein